MKQLFALWLLPTRAIASQISRRNLAWGTAFLFCILCVLAVSKTRGYMAYLIWHDLYAVGFAGLAGLASVWWMTLGISISRLFSPQIVRWSSRHLRFIAMAMVGTWLGLSVAIATSLQIVGSRSNFWAVLCVSELFLLICPLAFWWPSISVILMYITATMLVVTTLLGGVGVVEGGVGAGVSGGVAAIMAFVFAGIGGATLWRLLTGPVSWRYRHHCTLKLQLSVLESGVVKPWALGNRLRCSYVAYKLRSTSDPFKVAHLAIGRFWTEVSVGGGAALVAAASLAVICLLWIFMGPTFELFNDPKFARTFYVSLALMQVAPLLTMTAQLVRNYPDLSLLCIVPGAPRRQTWHDWIASRVTWLMSVNFGISAIQCLALYGLTALPSSFLYHWLHSAWLLHVVWLSFQFFTLRYIQHASIMLAIGSTATLATAGCLFIVEPEPFLTTLAMVIAAAAARSVYASGRNSGSRRIGEHTFITNLGYAHRRLFGSKVV